jgi:hypothetical protein
MPLGAAEARGQKRLDELQRDPSPITLPPRQKTFMSSSSTPWYVEKTSWMSPARTPGILFAAMFAPTPLPQIAMARSISPEAIDLARGITKSGQSYPPGSARGREVEDLMSCAAQLRRDRAFQREAAVVGGDPNAHRGSSGN